MGQPLCWAQPVAMLPAVDRKALAKTGDDDGGMGFTSASPQLATLATTRARARRALAAQLTPPWPPAAPGGAVAGGACRLAL